MTAVDSAVTDPEGARVALLTFGRLEGFPSAQIGPLKFQEGEEAWTATLRVAHPPFLGLAWSQLDRFESLDALERAREFTQQRQSALDSRKANKGETNVPVLQWKESSYLEAGDYPATVSEITETDGKFGPQLQFQFAILDKDGQKTNREIRAWCSTNWGPKTRLFEWARIILGKKKVLDNQAFDTDMLINRKCDIRVEEKANAEGQMRSHVTNLFPFRTVSVTQADDEESDEIPFESRK